MVKVFAKIIKLNVEGQTYFLRENAEIQFGTSSEWLGSTVMTNPGSFQFSNHVEWQPVPNSQGKLSFAESTGSPDPTMNNIITVVKESYQRAGFGSPSGIVRIRNLSTIREANSRLVPQLHETVKEILKQQGLDHHLSLLEDPFCRTEEGFHHLVQESPFVIMGFVKKLFVNEVTNLTRWAQERDNLRLSFASPFVCAPLDGGKWCSHPYTWNIRHNLREQAIQRLTQRLIDLKQGTEG